MAKCLPWKGLIVQIIWIPPLSLAWLYRHFALLWCHLVVKCSMITALLAQCEEWVCTPEEFRDRAGRLCWCLAQHRRLESWCLLEIQIQDCFIGNPVAYNIAKLVVQGSQCKNHSKYKGKKDSKCFRHLDFIQLHYPIIYKINHKTSLNHSSKHNSPKITDICFSIEKNIVLV